MKRTNFLRVCVILTFAVILGRLFYIQIIMHDDYVAKAAQEHISENVLEADRGDIYMMDGANIVPVVMNETVYTVIFDPSVVNEEKAKDVLEKYAGDGIIAKWEDVFKDKTRKYFVVAKNVEYEKAKKIEEEKLAGVYFEQQNKRVYIEGDLASQTLGFVNNDGVGQYGVEGALDKRLAGTNGLLKTVRDVNGTKLSIGNDNIEVPAIDGENIVLTIDRNIQKKIEGILAKKVDVSYATNASAVVLDPNNGKILAMVNYPNYDPSKYWDVKDASIYQNNVTEGAYEAASVCKTFTFAAAIDLGVMNANTTYYNTGFMVVDGLRFKNAYVGLIGTIDMGTALRYSLNTGSATALKLIGGGEFNEEGRVKLYDYLTRFRLGKETGVEIYENIGFVPSPNQYDYTMNFTYANMTFGQGMNVTLLQVASSVASIINGGNYYVPYLVAGQVVDGKLVEDKHKDVSKNIINKSTSDQMRELLYGNRIAQRQKGIDKKGYYIGGKSGTGQVILEDGSYSKETEETVASYVGFGGADEEDSQYVVAVKIWGKGHYFAGTDDAQPLFDEISNYLIDYLKIRPKM